MRCDVSTFPPQTAAVRDGDNRLPLGIRTATKKELNENNDAEERVSTVQGDQATRIEWDVNVQHGTHAIYHR